MGQFVEVPWICVRQELEKARGMTQSFSAPGGCLPMQSEIGGRSLLRVMDAAARRKVAPRSCVHRLPSRDERLLAAQGKLQGEKETSASSFRPLRGGLLLFLVV